MKFTLRKCTHHTVIRLFGLTHRIIELTLFVCLFVCKIYLKVSHGVFGTVLTSDKTRKLLSVQFLSEC